MSSEMTPLDLEAVLGGLKDFQRNTVEYVFRRLYLDEDPAHRFLVADEVGLGKTLVARGLIARTIDHLKDEVDRVDIIYICSNADIARQNINRLNITGRGDFTLSSRITLLPTELHNLRENRLNFISFTPQTSFELKSSLGKVEERILLYWLLDRAWGLRGTTPLNVLQGGVKNTGWFRHMVGQFDPEKRIDDSLAERFVKDLKRRSDEDAAAGRPDLRSRFEVLSDKFRRSDSRVSGHDKWERRQVIGELRTILAESCLEALEPDLIILDEFQRFKHLLDDEDPVSELAHGLFDYADEQSKARVVLLSATPYKMYTLSHESAEDNHYGDFLKTLRFLESGSLEAGRVEEILKQYREELFRLGNGDDPERLTACKKELENRLRRVMVRTERLAVSENRDGMLEEVPSKGVKLEARDLEGYVTLQKISRALGQGDVLEYWKSAPYLLNFMDSYRLKRAFQETVSIASDGGELADLLAGGDGLLLPWEDIHGYSEVDPGNARLRDLLADTVESDAWRLLWMPPSMPYYRSEGAFADPAAERLTKRLVFSSWVVAPKVIATLLSYEAERRMIRSFEDEPENSAEARQRRRPLLRFPPPQGDRRHPPGMPVLGLLYPCTTLARECDPLRAARDLKGDGLPTLDDVLQWAQRRIEPLLREVGVEREGEGAEDEAWYWAAPILIDLHRDREATLDWLRDPQLAATWSGEEREESGSEEDRTHWSEHVEEARKLAEGLEPGRAPADLSRVLALEAIAGPGTVALRALWRITGGQGGKESRSAAGRVAWGLRSLFNTPEATALLRERDRREAYWRSVLEYAASGGLQATLDEYAHVLREAQGLLDEPPEKVVGEVSRAMREALGIRTSTMVVDEVAVNVGRGGIRLESHRMRGHFALRFGEERSDDGKEMTRAGQVREAFNSPFRPFVLATTSVGQEGLDFHTYCHAVVHWNLPSNPVDLEQREGRVHRYKGHAVRKNLARKYGLSEVEDISGDPWAQLFDAGKRDRPTGTSDIVPYWIYPLKDGAKIERHVPALPLSRDEARLTALRRSLAAYRMVFGQARQEDLLAYLLARLPDEEASRVADELRIDLEPPQHPGDAEA